MEHLLSDPLFLGTVSTSSLLVGLWRLYLARMDSRYLNQVRERRLFRGPRLLVAVAERMLSAHQAGDLIEEYQIRLLEYGHRRARRWYRSQVLRSVAQALLQNVLGLLPGRRRNK